jgi:endonuclease/exonuclease/phosphatase family metal-dependent hydrolase
MSRQRVAIALATCAVVGGLVPAAAARQSPAAGASGELIALSYNVAGLTEQVSGSEPSTNSALISPLLNDYELVLLQEDWEDPVEQQDGIERPGSLPAMFYHHMIVRDAEHPYRSAPAVHPYGTDLRRAPSGPTLISDGLNRLSWLPFGTLTRVMWESCYGDLAFELTQTGLQALTLDQVLDDLGLTEVNQATDGGGADCMAQKGFSVARTRLATGVEVDVYNVHADSGSHPEDLAARKRNFKQLAEFMTIHSAGRAVIVGGDTNLKTASDDPARAQYDEKVWKTFQVATGLADVCNVVDCGADAQVNDKFAFRSNDDITLTPRTHRFERAKFQRDDGAPLSDHDPLTVAFRWRAERHVA